MMEYWVGIILSEFSADLTHFALFHCSNIPVFPCSDIPAFPFLKGENDGKENHI